ncbi:MAG TPA: carboxypeptidase-like regulatory domain-containing protein [Candidatus Sulfotelmatobacter sp.]|nr:carboxypeptidase-like regulatory domain-containing protein [Candidatus Sulfotelmatobacter sp.]
MKHGWFLCFGIVFAAALGVCVSAPPAAAQVHAKTSSGTIAGQVRDAGGIPQLGATVDILAEAPGVSLSKQFLTNTQGVFRAENLPPGLYTIRVALAGFLPGLEKHVQISSNLTTVVRIELESLYAAIEELRRAPANGVAEPDDWKWVLRSASGLRPVLQWHEEDTEVSSSVVADAGKSLPLGRIEITGGARRPGSVSSIDAAPATAFAYDQRIDGSNQIVFAGQASYDQESPAGGLAAMWLPTGSLENGPRSTMVLREAKIGPVSPIFRGVRLDQSASMTFGDRFLLRVGGEYVLVGAGAAAWSARPRVSWESRIAPNWYVDAIYAALPVGIAEADSSFSDLTGSPAPGVLASALDQLDSFPALMWRGGRPVLENGRHEELSGEHKFGTRGALQLAAFHDDSTHVALFGKGADLPAPDYFQDFYSKEFAYDGGSSVSWGTRAALREKLTEDLELTTIYAFSGALVPISAPDGVLRDALRTMPRHSAAVKVTGRLPMTGTKLTAGYKWINGTALSRVDPYGEGVYDVNPYLHVGIRQPLPWVSLGRLEANAECDNLLAQGYMPINTRDGQMLLVPAFRTFRGGLSLQF